MRELLPSHTFLYTYSYIWAENSLLAWLPIQHRPEVFIQLWTVGHLKETHTTRIILLRMTGEMSLYWYFLKEILWKEHSFTVPENNCNSTFLFMYLRFSPPSEISWRSFFGSDWTKSFKWHSSSTSHSSRSECFPSGSKFDCSVPENKMGS